MKKLISLILALCLALSLTLSFAEPDIRTATAADYTGKTVILHSNDVHGQIDGYAWMAGLRSYLKAWARR